MRIKLLNAYLKYLSISPRKLEYWSKDLNGSVAEGEWSIPSSQHPTGLINEAFKSRPGNRGDRALVISTSVAEDLTGQASSFIKAEESYQGLVQLVEQLFARDPKRIVN